MPGEVKLPGVGPVSRRALVLGGGGAVLVMGLLWWRKRTAATAAAAAAAPPAADQVDPGALDAGGTGMAGGGGSLTGPSQSTSANPTSNPQWTQLVLQQLGGTADPQALSAALGLYLTGGAVTQDQESLIDQAIAVAGYPPVAGPTGYPPAIRTQAGGGQPPGPSSGRQWVNVFGGEGVDDFIQTMNDLGVPLTWEKFQSLNPNLGQLVIWDPHGDHGKNRFAFATAVKVK